MLVDYESGSLSVLKGYTSPMVSIGDRRRINGTVLYLPLHVHLYALACPSRHFYMQ